MDKSQNHHVGLKKKKKAGTKDNIQNYIKFCNSKVIYNNEKSVVV